MAVAEKYRIEVKGLKEIQHKLEDSELLKDTWQKGMEAVGVIGEQFAITFAPMKSGRTIAKMSHRVQKKPVPLYAIVKTTARSNRGYSYPRLHEYSRRSPHYGWMYRAMVASKGLWEGVLSKTADDIERKWGD